MIGLLCFILAILTSPFKSKTRLEAENAALRHQLIVLRRKVKGRAHLTNNDRWFFILMYRWFPSILEVLVIIRPETVVHWHRAGFRRYWRWKSRRECLDHIVVFGEARFSGLESSVHTRYSADFIITTSGFRFSVHTGGQSK